MNTELANAQTAVFGSFGTQSDTVTALYKNDTNLFVGAKAPLSGNRLKVYDGSNLSSIGYSQPGTEITGIGRISGDSIVVFDKNGSVTTMSRYNGANWTNNFNQYTGQVFSAGDNGGSSGQGTIFTVSSSATYARVCGPSGLSTPWSNTLGVLQTYDFTYHNSKMYACGFGTNASMRIYETSGASWVSSNITIPAGWYTVHEIESYGSYLYFVVRNTAGTLDELFRWNSAMGSTPEQLGISGQFNDLEVHDGKLFLAGDDLRSFDGTTWSTLTTLSNGQILIMESYGTKLALGGSFEDVDGNTALDHLAYLEFVTVPTAQFSLSDTELCQGESLTMNNTTSGVVDSYAWDIQGGTPSTSTLQNPGSITFLIPGTYMITLTVSNADGSDTYAETVFVHSNLEPVITANGPTTFCAGESVVLDAGAGYQSYLWSGGGITQTLAVSSSGSFAVTVADNNGCIGTSTPITVTVNTNPTPVITPTGNDLTSNYATGNQWAVDFSPIGVSQTITPFINGTYTVTVTDINGCVGTSAGFIVEDLSLNEAEITEHVSITNGQLSITVDWALYDASGRLISTGKPGTYDLPSGIFLLLTELGNVRFYNQ